MLTKKQFELLEFINTRIQKDSVTPSFDEMKDALNLRSKSGIHRLVSALEERGYLRRLAHKARAIEILKLPDQLQSDTRGFTPRVIEGGGAAASEVVSRLPSVEAVNIPMMGKIAAGIPIAAIPDGAESVAVPNSMLGGSGKHYSLEITGQSMVDVGINDGDIVIIRETNVVQDGDIVVAMVEDYETTLKTYRRKGDRIILEAANSAYETRSLPVEKVEIQGKLVGLIRNYDQ